MRARPLDILGVSAAEEQVYRCLLRRPGMTASEISLDLSRTVEETKRLLGATEAKGLTTHVPDRPPRYLPVSPDIAMEALILQRQEMLQRARSIVKEMQLSAAGESRDVRMVELVTSQAAEQKILNHLYRTARQEVVTLIRPPLRVSRLESLEEDHNSQRESQMHGVRYRSIVDSGFLAIPGAVGAMQKDAEAGEEFRFLPSLPLKMVLSDRRIAIIPLSLGRPEGASLLVRSSALLDALYAFFETLWDRAEFMSYSSAGLVKAGHAGLALDDREREIVMMMTAGLNDKTIAYQLGISARTLNRSIAKIMEAFGARTRFQLGRFSSRYEP